MFRIVIVSCFLMVGSITLAAGPAEKKAAVEKVKATVEAALAKAEIKPIGKAETDHLLVYGTMSDAKVKTIAEAAQKSFAFAAKSLKVEKVDDLFAAKLVVFIVPDRKPYANLVQAIDGKRPDQSETYEVKARGDVPFVSIGTGIGEKPTDADIANAAACWTAAAVLNKKLGTDPGAFDLPEWAQLGYGKIATLRMEGNAAKLTAFRTKAKSLVNGKLRGPVSIKDAWSGSKGKDHETLVTSVVDFLAFGPDPERFGKLALGFKKSDDNRDPSIDRILQSLEWKWDTLDAEWKTYVIKLK